METKGLYFESNQPIDVSASSYESQRIASSPQTCLSYGLEHLDTPDCQFRICSRHRVALGRLQWLRTHNQFIALLQSDAIIRDQDIVTYGHGETPDEAIRNAIFHAKIDPCKKMQKLAAELIKILLTEPSTNS